MKRSLTDRRARRNRWRRHIRRYSVLVGFLLLAGSAWAQEDEKTPSAKTKEALEKFSKTPSAVRKSLETAADKAKKALQENLATKEPDKRDSDPLSLPSRNVEPQRPRYSPGTRRDPFRPFTAASKPRPARENLSPLERYEVGQLKLVGIVWDTKDPKAMLEDSAGLGYIVKVGTPIGTNEGKVKQITPTEVVVQETFSDFYGTRKNREIRIKLPAE